MNLLQYETSPYLLQHANNPVDWYPWREEALERAKREDKPILVSIGYSTCHWCHVMEHESFEDEAIAAYMNAHFINIKVDREERPDLDDIYMSACQIINGNGGWPLNCFLTPEGKPFFAGTYFPPKENHGRPSWSKILQYIHYNYKENKDAVYKQADRIMERITLGDDVHSQPELDLKLDNNLKKQELKKSIDNAFTHIQQRFDTIYGGFGTAPKFPDLMQLRFLLRHGFAENNTESIEHVHKSLTAMINGGIYDHLGGGLARYSTDIEWLAPHFEKMLYDNALFIDVLSEAHQMKNNDLYKKTVEDTIAFIQRELYHEESGAFYSALDADSEGEEGLFYVWSKKEIEQILGEDAPFFNKYYDVTEKGNWEGHNILRVRHSMDAIAHQLGYDTETAHLKLAQLRKKLFEQRAKRIRPGRDEKILTNWNALMSKALAKAGKVFGRKEWVDMAAKNIQFILDEMHTTDHYHLYHTASLSKEQWKKQYTAYLDDYAYMIDALIELYECTFDTTILDKALDYTELVIKEFKTKEGVDFYFTSSLHKDIVVRKKNLYDGALPSGNSVMISKLQKIGLIYEKPDYLALSDDLIARMLPMIKQAAPSFSNYLLGIQNAYYGLSEIVIIGQDYPKKVMELNKKYVPFAIKMASEQANEQYPLLRNRSEGLIYLCKNYACLKPVESISELLELMEN